MAKLDDDKYYTPKTLARRLIQTTMRVLHKHGYVVTDVVEPSAGSGSFSSQLKCTAYDIRPEADGIIKADFLTVLIKYKPGRLCIGNPPFGNRNALSVKFFKKCSKIGDFIAFVQPISQLNNNLQMYDFDLIYSEDLGILDYSTKPLHCCFNVYARPTGRTINKKPDYSLRDVTLIEHRRGSEHLQSMQVKPGYDYAICSWGSGLGNRPQYVGQYAQEIYVYVNNRKYLRQVGRLLEPDVLRRYVKSVATMKISKARLYKYLRDNIDGIQ